MQMFRGIKRFVLLTRQKKRPEGQDYVDVAGDELVKIAGD